MIAGVGLFGVLSYTTSQRTREIGLRTALGARRGDVLALVGRQALTITAAGLAVGLVAAFFLSQSLSTLLYGISTRDALSFLVVPLVLIGRVDRRRALRLPGARRASIRWWRCGRMTEPVASSKVKVRSQPLTSELSTFRRSAHWPHCDRMPSAS